MVTKAPLPAGFTIGKSFEYGLDANLGTYESPIWQSFRRISGFQPTPKPTTQDAQTYDDLGAPNEDTTAWGVDLAFNVQVNRSLTTGLYLPEVEYLLARTRPSAVGELAIADCRWYHKPALGTPNPTDAGRGLFRVAPARQNTGPGGEIESFGFTLTGKGTYDEIPNPWTGWNDNPAPAIMSITPTGRAAGQQVRIDGLGFGGATAVKFGTTDAAFTIVSPNTVIATVPSGSAGSVNITVVTPVGTSPAKAYTRA